MNQKYPHPILAREGWPYIGGTFLLALLWTSLAGFGFVAALLWIFFIIVTQFFRDPPRTVPTMPEAVLSPADGQIVKVDKTIGPDNNEAAILVRCFMNVFTVNFQLFSVTDTFEDVQYYPGKFLNADLDKASTENERNAVIVRVNDGNRITVVQVAGLVARRILCYIQKGDQLSKGERYGFIRFGSRLDVYLPTDATPCVTIGEKVLGTETILAKLAPKA